MKCDECNGHGVVADYGPLGLDFEGAKECVCCHGSGVIRRMAPTAKPKTKTGVKLDNNQSNSS